MKTKTFDCVKMKDRIQADIFKDVKALDTEAQIAYYKQFTQGSSQLRDKMARIQRIKTG